MKTTHLLKALTAALLLAAALSPGHAASLLTNGDFDSLPVGTAPDVGRPVGGWSQNPDAEATETAPSQVTIAPAPAGGTGNALRLSLAEGEFADDSMEALKYLTRAVTTDSGQILNVSFDIYVEPGAIGPGVVLAQSDPNTRTAQLSWGSLTPGPNTLTAWEYTGPDLSAPTTLLSTYPRGIWQTVRLEVDLARARYNFYWSEKGQPVSVTRTNLRFHRDAPRTHIHLIRVIRFAQYSAAMRASVDDFRVTTDPAIAPVNADLAAGGSTTLQVVNLPAGDAIIQWRRNGQDIDGATAATLELGNITTEQAGTYTAVITRDGQSVTTDPSTVRVFDRLTITTPPQAVSLPSGKATGFSVAATGPLPMTYQWRRNGVDLPGKTSRFLTLSATAAAAGDYTVVVSDANGSVVSEPAPLTVLVNPTFTQAPISMRVVAGSSVTFSAAVAGTGPFTYQWRKGSSFDTSTVRATQTGAGTTAFFTLDNVQAAQGGAYRLALANPAMPDLTITSPSRSFTLTVLPDTDADGLPDEWETANGLNPADPVDALLDRDDNGVPNLTEYQTGSVTGLQVESVTPAEGQATVGFTAAAGLTYTVEASSEAAGGAWEKVADVVAKASSRAETVTDPKGAEAARFYRVVTPRRP